MSEGNIFEIQTKPDGSFQDIVLRDSVLSDPIEFGFPIINLSGANRYEELRAFNVSAPASRGIYFASSVQDAREMLYNIPRQSELQKFFVDSRYSPEFLRISHFASRVDFSEIKFEEMLGVNAIDSIRDLIKRSKRSKRISAEFEDYIKRIDEIADRNPIAVNFSRQSFAEDIIAFEVWISRERSNPIVILSVDKIPSDDSFLTHQNSRIISLAELLQSMRDKFGLSAEDVSNSYRIWNYSRRRLGFRAAPASSGASITLSSAFDLCSAVSDTFEARIREAKRPTQVAAPAKFHFGESGIDIVRSNTSSDSDVIVRAGAKSLKLKCERFKDCGLHNHIPNLNESIEIAISLLEEISTNGYDDGHIVAFGLEMNGLQWQIDGIKDRVDAVSLAEGVSLFANSHLFLNRFDVWRGYVNRSSVSESDAYADFSNARSILIGARSENGLLSDDASKRIEHVLKSSTDRSEVPSVRDGVVSSGENLTAAVVTGLSELVIKEARGAGGKIKDEVYKESGKVLVKYTQENMPKLLKVTRGLPWAQWAESIFSDWFG